MKYTHKIELNVVTMSAAFTQHLFFTDGAEAALAMEAARTAIEDGRKCKNDRPVMLTLRDALGQLNVDADKILSARSIDMIDAVELDTECAERNAKFEAIRSGKEGA